jgi:hypothetical protein
MSITEKYFAFASPIESSMSFKRDSGKISGLVTLLTLRLAQANLRLKSEKCTFVAKHVKYLGHVITKDGIEVDEEKTAAVSNFPRPKNVHDVRSFLGLCNNYKRFIKSYVIILRKYITNALSRRIC